MQDKTSSKPQKGTMHAFPPTGGNVAVSLFGNGAGSNANAVASEQGIQTVGGGPGASHKPPALAQSGNAWSRRPAFATGGENAKEINPEHFPSLLSAQEKKSKRQAEHFSFDQRKVERAVRKAAKQLGKQAVHQNVAQEEPDSKETSVAEQRRTARVAHDAKVAARRAEKQLRQQLWLEDKAAQEKPKERRGPRTTPRSHGKGIAKQQRVMKLQRRMARQAAQEEAKARAEAQQDAAHEAAGMDDGEISFSTTQSLTFTASGADGAEDVSESMPTKSLLAGSMASDGGPRAKKRSSESRDEPPKELVEALLEEFPHSNEKQAQCALLMSRQLHSEGKPGWRIVHAARLMPPAPPGAPSNPIQLLSSDASSPEQTSAAKELKRIREMALASKPTWCQHLSFSLGIEEAYVAQVFDLYRPRSLDTLEAFTVGELAEELEMDVATLVRELTQSNAEAGCKPAAGAPQAMDDDDDADAGGAAQRTRRDAAQGGATAGASGHGRTSLMRNTGTLEGVVGDSGTDTVGGSRALQAQRDGAVDGAATVNVKESGESGVHRQSTLTFGGALARAWRTEPAAQDEGAAQQQAAVESATHGGNARMQRINGPSEQRATLESAAGGGDGKTHSRADQLRLTSAGLKVLLELHNGKRDLLQPLEAGTCGELVTQLKAEAQLKYGGTLTDAVALGALEVARHLPQSSGWSTVEQALACLQKRGQATQHAEQAAQQDRTTSGTPVAAATTASGWHAEAERQRLGEALGEGAVSDILRRVLLEGQTGKQRAAATPAPVAATVTLRTPGVHPTDERRHLAAMQLVATLRSRRGPPENGQLGGGMQGGIAMGRNPTAQPAGLELRARQDGANIEGASESKHDSERPAPATEGSAEQANGAATSGCGSAAQPSSGNVTGSEWIVALSKSLEVDEEFLISIYARNRPITIRQFEALAVQELARERSISAEQMWREVLQYKQKGLQPPALTDNSDSSESDSGEGRSNHDEHSCSSSGDEGDGEENETEASGTRGSGGEDPRGGEGVRAEKPAGRSCHTRGRAGDERCMTERPCRRHHHQQQHCKESKGLSNQGRNNELGCAPGKEQEAGSTPDSARFVGAEYSKTVEAAAGALENRISEAVALALRAALPQLAKHDNARTPGKRAEQGVSGEENTILRNLRIQLASPDLQGLGKREALSIAAKRAARNLETELFDADNRKQRDRRGKLKRKHSGDNRGCGSESDDRNTDSGSDLSSEDSDHSRNRGQHNRGVLYPSPAARASAMGQLIQHAAAAAVGQTVVVLGNSKLPVWKMGSESNLQGFNWKTKQHIYHLWEQYMLAEGQHAPKEFKSLISPELIPVICAETGLRASDWPFLSDGLVTAKIDKALRPTRSTDFALQLQQITLAQGKPGTLLARYRIFMEKFLAKVAEAEAAERPVKDNVVKDAFKDALIGESVLKMWLREVNWRGVDKAHRRLMRKLKESHSWDQLRDENERKGAKWRRNNEDGEQTPRRWQQRREQVESHFAASKEVKVKGGEKFLNGKRPSAQKEANSPLRGPHPGLDKRGPSWHKASDCITCRVSPCKSKFCQRCGHHAHTAETCRSPDDTPGINLKGYYQEAKGNAAPVSRKGLTHQFGAPPARLHSNAAERKGRRGGKANRMKPGEDSVEGSDSE